MKKISVLLADDHTVVRQGLRTLLMTEPDIDVVAEAENGRQAVQLALQLKPDVIVMDIAMPQLNGLEAAKQITEENLPVKLLILSSYADSEYVHQLTAAGAAGYVIKQTAASDLINAVREVSKGNAFFSPPVLKQLLEYYREACRRGGLQPQSGGQLTSREQEVLQLVAEGHVNKQIASTLFLSIKTVEKHRQQLMNKLGIHDIAGLTRYAIAHGVVESRRRLVGDDDGSRNEANDGAASGSRSLPKESSTSASSSTSNVQGPTLNVQRPETDGAAATATAELKAAAPRRRAKSAESVKM